MQDFVEQLALRTGWQDLHVAAAALPLGLLLVVVCFGLRDRSAPLRGQVDSAKAVREDDLRAQLIERSFKKFQEMERESGALQEAFQRSISNLETSLEPQKASMREVRWEVRALQAAFEDSRAEVAELQSVVKAAKKEASELQEKQAAAEVEHQDLRKRLRCLEATNEAMLRHLQAESAASYKGAVGMPAELATTPAAGG